MDEGARKTLIASYQKRKEVVITHPYIDKKMHLETLLTSPLKSQRLFRLL